MWGRPRRLTDLSSAMRNFSTDMSDESSRWSALAVAQVKRIMWDYADWSFFVYRGPAKSIPLTANGVEGCTRSAGKGASTTRSRALLAILQGLQVRRTFLMFCRALRIQNSCLRWDSTTRTPKLCNRMWVCCINKCV